VISYKSGALFAAALFQFCRILAERIRNVMAKDKYHKLVRLALENDGWTVTHDPYFLYVGRRKGFIDLGAERDFLGAERDSEKIAVKIKSFLGSSDLDEFEDALGQFLVYLTALEEKEPERVFVVSRCTKYILQPLF
jgi:hypothetical protein